MLVKVPGNLMDADMKDIYVYILINAYWHSTWQLCKQILCPKYKPREARECNSSRRERGSHPRENSFSDKTQRDSHTVLEGI